jgi:hypothetical protein
VWRSAQDETVGRIQRAIHLSAVSSDDDDPSLSRVSLLDRPNGSATLPMVRIPCLQEEVDPPSRRIESSAGATASGTCSDGVSCPRSAAAMTSFCADQ